MHPLRYLAPLLVLLVLALGVSACGEDEDSTTDPRDVATSTTSSDQDGESAAGEQAEAELDVRIEKVGSKDGGGIPIPAAMRCTRSIPATCSATVTCPAADDAEAGAAEVCTWLRTDGPEVLLSEPPANQACTMIYGGPEVATVTGTLDGKSVDATFSRQDGCAIARFEQASPLWTGEVPPAGDPNSSSDPSTPPTTPPTGDPDAPVSNPQPEENIVTDPPEAFE